ncbi:MAG: phospholipid/cholesterol/gamma-HCH transport system permease protein [Nocardioidaceae bacterium]|jgi:phospholipid/cholesterol/gamma-HCH transport system permease protein|nr:phospholipid/cholesterol/gamma-HCH transport system permease protein [Nocardioidaceae bacterium]
MTQTLEPQQRPHIPRHLSEIVVDAVPGPLRRLILEVGAMTRLFWDATYSALRYPRGYWTATRDEMYDSLRYGFAAAAGTVLLFTFVISSVGYGILNALGSPERMSQFTLTIGVRESAPFMTAMVVAGVMGTAVTADLGARKIREEIDAMRVLGVDPLRALVIPRLISLSAITFLLTIVSVVATVLCGILVGVVIKDLSMAVYMENLFRNTNAPELWTMVVKTIVIGCLVAVVHCYKGMTVGGGAADVGKAVNQAVVIVFVGMFVINFAFNAASQGLFPEIQTVR